MRLDADAAPHQIPTLESQLHWTDQPELLGPTTWRTRQVPPPPPPSHAHDACLFTEMHTPTLPYTMRSRLWPAWHAVRFRMRLQYPVAGCESSQV